MLALKCRYALTPLSACTHIQCLIISVTENYLLTFLHLLPRRTARVQIYSLDPVWMEFLLSTKMAEHLFYSGVYSWGGL